jgi:hypothetical protein
MMQYKKPLVMENKFFIITLLLVSLVTLMGCLLFSFISIYQVIEIFRKLFKLS